MSALEDDLREEVAYLKSRIAELTGGERWIVVREALKLSPQQAKILTLLSTSPGKVVKRGPLYEAVFLHDDGDGPFEQILNVLIAKLRRSLRDRSAPDGVKNSWGVGYSVTPELAAWVNARTKIGEA